VFEARHLGRRPSEQFSELLARQIGVYAQSAKVLAELQAS
jgi:hypothetical protein